MKTTSLFILPTMAILSHTAVAFAPSPTALSFKTPSSHIILQQAVDDDANAITNTNKMVTSRRDYLLQNTALVASSLFLASGKANASGGATAGGAYLLSAKQRYNERVTKGVKAFLDLEGGSVSAVNDFFTSEEVGGWKDASSAGYLLSNAFRRSSSTAPDSLPSVKKWKAFAKEAETMAKYASKKKTNDTFESYKKALVLLDEYLEAVELPPAIEMRSL
mmetsp:Transcript_28791/g.42024  ORF Transcript_28791/g.42024 Transcript_28791/m.42024 type:complete len:220 (+) Transcript_28791:79-738(+)